MTLRAAIYARVSTDRQRERHTIDSQLRVLPEYAARELWEIVEIYKDDGRSGETVENRPAFKKLLDDAAERRFDVVLVIDLDRITRSRKSAEGALIFDHLRENGVKLATPTQGLIDLDDEDQDLLVGIKREVAKWEKRKIVRRMMRGKREAALKGRRFSCLDPYGYRWVKNESDPRGGSYETDEKEAAVVRRIFVLAIDEGLGRSMIAWRLNAEGYRTRAIRRGSRPDGQPGPWARSTIAKILRSTTYKGEFRVFKKDEGPTIIRVPAIVESDRWRLAQEALAHRRPEPRWKHDRRYLIAGHVRCGVCGYVMWVVNARGDRARSAYYRCSTTNAWRTLRLSGPCGNLHHRVDAVDESVWKKLLEVLRSPTALARACSLDTEAGAADLEAQADVAQRRLGDLERIAAEALRRHRRGLISTSACDQELEEIASERKLAERAVQAAEQRRAHSGARSRHLHDAQEHAAALAASVGEASFEDRRRLVQLLLPREQGCGVLLHSDRRVEIRGLLALPSDRLSLQLVTRAG